MKITDYEDNYMFFDDDSFISGESTSSGFQYNYIDFDAAFGIDPETKNYEFETFEVKPTEYGIIVELIGLPHKQLGTWNKKFFVPCYSEQNGYYSRELQINIYNKHEAKRDSFNINDLQAP